MAAALKDQFGEGVPREIARMILDVGAGFGEPMHVARLMEEVREARIDSVHL